LVDRTSADFEHLIMSLTVSNRRRLRWEGRQELQPSSKRDYEPFLCSLLVLLE